MAFYVLEFPTNRSKIKILKDDSTEPNQTKSINTFFSTVRNCNVTCRMLKVNPPAVLRNRIPSAGVLCGPVKEIAEK